MTRMMSSRGLSLSSTSTFALVRAGLVWLMSSPPADSDLETSSSLESWSLTVFGSGFLRLAVASDSAAIVRFCGWSYQKGEMGGAINWLEFSIGRKVKEHAVKN